MELTILLAKIIGSYMIIVGMALLLHKSFFLTGISSFRGNKESRLILAVIDVLIGLVIVYVYTDWSTLPSVLITLVGWVTLLRGVVSMFVNDVLFEKLTSIFLRKNLYFPTAIIAIAIGFYLTLFGFGCF